MRPKAQDPRYPPITGSRAGGAPLTITGTTSGIATNAPVSLSLGGQTYTLETLPDPDNPDDVGDAALVKENGTWEIEIPAADLAALADADLTVTVSSFFGSDPVEGTRDLTVGEGGGGVDAPTDGDDNITGTDGVDVIDGGAGSDLLFGFGAMMPLQLAAVLTLLCSVPIGALTLFMTLRTVAI